MTFGVHEDTGHPWRLNKFVTYYADGIDEIAVPLKALMEGTSLSDRVWISFLFSVCYSLGTAYFMYTQLDYKTVTLERLEKFWRIFKTRLVFQTDRKYVKNNNEFVGIVWGFIQRCRRNPAGFIKGFIRDTPQDTYDALYKEICSWRYYGRFASVLLLRTLVKITPLKADSKYYDWKNGKTTTAGAFAILYRDDEAVKFTQDGKLTRQQIADLYDIFYQIKELTGGTVLSITSTLCSFYKMFRGERYQGYYIDRQQEEINILSAALPNFAHVWDRLWEARKAMPHDLLGELNGWDGIRRDRNDMFLETGKAGKEQYETIC
jgi:hypothetical protein